MLPAPPTFHRSPCAAGHDGASGCRRCVDSCPYQALRIRASPSGIEISLDPGLCRRCGACTSVCPTGAMERSFLPHQELMDTLERTVTEAPTPPVLLLLGAELVSQVAPRILHLPVATLPLSSLLVVDERHLLLAARAGAVGVAVVGTPMSHHGAPALLEDVLQLAQALGGVPSTYLEGGDPSRTVSELGRFIQSLPDDPADAWGKASSEPVETWSSLPSVRIPERRFDLAALMDGSQRTLGGLTQAPFGHVEVEESGCTLCGACARSCPTSALSFSPDGGSLEFLPLACVACGLCMEACPEDVLSMESGLDGCGDLLASRTLVHDEVVPCSVCGAPHLPARLVNRVRELLSGRTDLPPEAEEVDRCPACRATGVTPTWALYPESSDDLLRTSQDELNAGGCGEGCACSSQRLDVQQAETLGDELQRRDFLKGLSTAAAAVGAWLGGGSRLEAAPALQGSGGALAKRWAMVIDLERCIGCHACTVACKAENHVPLGSFRDWVEEHLLGEYPHAIPYFLPKLCNQCDDAGCLRACPTGAIHRRDDGIVDLNHDICIGCRACNLACPYGMTFMNPDRGTADKCNFCAHRIDEGLNPACVDVCPSRCRIFGDLNDPESPVSTYLRDRPSQVLRRDLGLGPNVHYVGLPAHLNR